VTVRVTLCRGRGRGCLPSPLPHLVETYQPMLLICGCMKQERLGRGRCSRADHSRPSLRLNGRFTEQEAASLSCSCLYVSTHPTHQLDALQLFTSAGYARLAYSCQ
jgi:hypothetical protein